MTTHIALVGEQPLPILLPIRYLNPAQTVLLHTQRTERVAKRLQTLIANSTLASIDAYELEAGLQQMDAVAASHPDISINLTGGTKIMSLAAFALAVRRSSPFLYIESEGNATRMMQYTIHDGQPALDSQVTISPVITIEDYLLAHVPSYEVSGFSQDIRGNLTIGGRFERAVYNALHKEVGHRIDEVIAGVRPGGVAEQIEMDLLIRIGNQVGVAEIKYRAQRSSGANAHNGADTTTTEGPKRGIDQLATATGREYLGIYTKKFLIMSRRVPQTIRTLAAQKGIHVIELTRYRDSASATLTEEDLGILVQAVVDALQPPQAKGK